MRTLVIAAIASVLAVIPGPVEAQRIAPPAQGGWTGGPPPGGQWSGQPQGGHWSGGGWQGGAQPMPPRPMPGPNGGPHRSRWGGRTNGYWYAGVQAPGGWNAYRRMKRGRVLPGYWISQAFYIGDWSTYGLIAPPPGYFWTRYYNDAVLIDRSGRVYDSVAGINWDTYGAYDDGDYGSGYNGGYGYNGPGYGYDGPPPAYGAPYPAPGATYSQSPDGNVRTWTSTTVAGGGYAPISPIVVPAGAVATVTVPGAVTTTTTTEYIEETYTPVRTAVVKKRVYRKPARTCWRPKPKPKPKPRCHC